MLGVYVVKCEKFLGECRVKGSPEEYRKVLKN